MSLASELIEAVRVGDADRVVRLVVAASEKDRRAAAEKVSEATQRYRWRGGKPGKRQAASLAWLGTTTAREVIQQFGLPLDDPADIPAAGRVLEARGRRFVETLARGILRQELWGFWALLRHAVQSGLVDRPDDPAYVIGMVPGLQVFGDVGQIDAIYRRLAAEPSLLDDVWGLFEVDAGAVLRASVVWDTKKWDGSTPPNPDEGKNRWQYALVRLAAEDRLDRSRLLAASLRALQRDFRPATVGWYSALHEALEPTMDERLECSDLYLALLGNSAPAAVKQGLAGLTKIEEALDPAELAGAVVEAFSLPQKAHSVAALQLLERAARREPAARAKVLEAAALALGHERTDVQERALRLIERYPDECVAVRAVLLGFTAAIAPSLRSRLEAVTGIATPEAVAPVRLATVRSWPPPRRPEPTPEVVLPQVEPLELVTGVSELIELAAALLEGQGTGDDAERFLDGVSRLCAERPRGFERRTASLLKRAGPEQGWFGLEDGAALIAMLVRAWVTGRRPHPLRDPYRGAFGQGAVRRLFSLAKAAVSPPKRFGVAGFVGDRVESVSRAVAAGMPRSLLALPTHAGGWIDPEVLRVRLGGRGHSGVDLEQARARAFPDACVRDVRSRLVEEKLHELEIEVEVSPGLGSLGDRLAETTPPSHYRWFGRGAWAGSDELSARWSMTVVPSLPEPAFVAALIDAVTFVDSTTTYGHPEIVLEHALAPYVQLPEIGWRAIASGLLAKSPDLQRRATDVLVQTIADGRFDPDLLGRSLAWLLDAGIGTSARLGSPLGDAGRTSLLHAAQVTRAVGVLAGAVQSTPRGFHVPLETALECAITAHVAVEDERARAGLERIASAGSRGSKLCRAASGLLARPLDEARLGELRAQAAETG
jgi:Family of unknown function (DUF6493)